MRRRILLVVPFLICILPSLCTATFSIVAHDPETGEWGVAVASREVAAGAFVPWLEAGVGVVATQAMINPAFGVDGLALMRSGFSAEQTLAALLERDGEAAATRQLALIDAGGGVAVHTSESLASYAGYRSGEGFSVQGNCLVGEEVLVEMERAYLDTDGPLALRLLEAMRAGDRAGGDRRGRQSAALRVAREKSDIRGVTDCLVDLRIDNHPEATQELAEAFMHWSHQIMVHFYMSSENTADLARGETLLDWIVAYEKGKPEPDPTNLHRMATYFMYGDLVPDTALALRRDHLGLEWRDDVARLNSFAWWCFEHEVNLEEAEVLARRGVDLSEGVERANVLDTLAEIVNARGRRNEARTLIDDALELNPDSDYLQSQKTRFAEEEAVGQGRSG